MERNPNKPRLARKDTTAEAFFTQTETRRVSKDTLLGMPDLSLADMTTGEQAGILCTDPAVREELLSSLEGTKGDKTQK